MTIMQLSRRLLGTEDTGKDAMSMASHLLANSDTQVAFLLYVHGIDLPKLLVKAFLLYYRMVDTAHKILITKIRAYRRAPVISYAF